MDKKHTILIVDDDAQFRKTLSDILQAKGYATVAVAKGETALGRVKKITPSVTAIDLKLEDIPGLELMRQIKSVSPDTECIVLTGYASQESAIEAVNLGAYSYMQKPYDVEQLLVTIRRAVEKREAELALRESEEKYRSVVESASEGIVLLDLKGNIMEANAKASEIGGLERKEIVGRHFAKLLPSVGMDVKSVVRAFKNVVLDRHPRSTEWTLTSGEGRQITFLAHYSLIRKAGKPAGVSIILEDITERKWAEEVVRDSEQKYRDLVENLEDVIYTVGEDGAVTYVSPAIESFLGYPPSEIVGRSFTEFVHEQDLEPVRESIRRILSGSTEANEYRVLTRSGKIRWIRASSRPMFVDNRVVGFQGVLGDITKRKWAEDALLDSERKYRELVENLDDVIYTVGRDGVATYVSPAIESCLGYTPSEIVGRSFTDFIHEQDLEMVRESVKRILSGDSTEANEYRLLTKSGEIRWIRTSSRPMFEDNRVVGLQGVLGDITERKQAEEALGKSEEQYRELVENLDDVIYAADEKGIVTYISPAIESVMGYTPRQLIGRRMTEFIHEDDLERITSNYQRILSGHPSPAHEYRVLCKTGVVRWVRTASRPILAEDRVVGVQGVLSDVTERRQAEEALRESEQRFRQFFENEPTYCYMVSPEGLILDVNAAALAVLGYEKEELVAKPLATVYAPESLPEAEQLFLKWKQTGELKDEELTVITKAGDRRTVLLSAAAVTDEDGRMLHSVSVQRDITDWKQAEEAYRQVVEHSLQGLLVIQDFRVVFANQAFAEISGYTIEELLALSTEKVQALVHPEDQASAWTRFRERLEGEPVPPRHEYRVVRKDGSVVWIEAFVNPIEYQGKPAVQAAIVDVTERRHAKQELEHSVQRLQTTLEGTVNALAALAEARDPYTAGHQQGVASLATAIAEEMGFSEERIRGTHMAGLIHDVGKIYVPAEITSKPSQLTALEMKMVQTHCQAGHDILKEIEFPWPVAQIVLQHHERMDGSGYPQGLSGEEIVLEARILGVADVVEAMVSHRPYRPAHALGDAFEEISKNRGTLYDPEVVDACLKVFIEKGFRFPSE